MNVIKLTARHYEESEKNLRPWPKYYTQLLNVASSNSKAASPKNVGSVKEAFTKMREQGIPGTLSNWIKFYNKTYGKDKLVAAADKIYTMLQKMEIKHISRDYCGEYIKELVYNKTQMGLGGEERAVIAVAGYYNLKYKFSTPQEESKGIDAWLVGKNKDVPIQVKPQDNIKKSHVHNQVDTNYLLYITYEDKKPICYIQNPEVMSRYEN